MTDRLELHVLASGSDGNCCVVSADGSALMVDAGLSGRAIERLVSSAGLDLAEIDAIILTHEHVDHVRGAGVLSRRHRIPVMGNTRTISAARLGRVERLIRFETLSEFAVGDIRVRPIPVSHGAAEPNGFTFEYRGRRCFLATDLGTVTPIVLDELRSADIALIESNHDIEMLMGGPYPPFLKASIRGELGHLSNRDCAQALAETHRRGRKVFLGHLSKNNNTVELARSEVAGALCCDIDEIGCLCTPGRVEYVRR